MSRRRALLIVNPNCRRGESDLSPVLSCLHAAGWEVDAHVSHSREHAALLIRESAECHDVVILGGGDGTLSGLIEPVLASRLPMAVLPMGTANDLARSLGLPPDELQAAEVIATGVVHRIDLGRVNGHYFFNAASIGIGVEVNRRLSKGIKGRWGVLSYARGLAGVARRARPFRAEIVCDGERRSVRSLQILVGNGRYYGGGMTVDAGAAIDDQRLDVISVPPRPPLRLLRLLPALRRGEHQRHEDLDVTHGRWVEVRTHRPRSVSADGETVTCTPARFEVVGGCLPVYVHADAAEGLSRVSQ